MAMARKDRTLRWNPQKHGVHDPTLPRWTVDDVAFDMDDLLVSDNEESDSDSSMDSSSESDMERDFKVNWEIEAQM
jgi:hypothetical protein